MSSQQRRDFRQTAEWRRMRLVVLARDGGVCQVKSPVCIGTASVAGHLVPGLNRIELLQAECKPCSDGHWTERLSGEEPEVERPAWL
jgi:5-methylcytosine-specific restriction endonuclease McrA